MFRSALQFGHGTYPVEIEPDQQQVPVPGEASIRPRHVPRGDFSPPSRSHATATWLQFGHGTYPVEIRPVPATGCRGPPCFNSATARTPWRSADLQGVVQVEGASIRPRHV